MLLHRVLTFHRSWLRQCTCFYSQKSGAPIVKGRTVKRFEQTLDGEAPKITTETHKVKLIDINQVTAKREAESAQQQKKIRRLHIWDKWILVKLGKYKKISDVPNEIKISNVKVDRELQSKVRAELQEKGFKYVTGLDYLMWALCLLLTVPIFYLYFVKKPDLLQTAKTNKQITESQLETQK